MKSLSISIERNLHFHGEFETEPYEAGWASEARWFLHVFELDAGSTISIVSQISVDGLFWCDYSTLEQNIKPLVITNPGLYSFPLTQFGQWLRVKAIHTSDKAKDQAVASMHMHLVLKG